MIRHTLHLIYRNFLRFKTTFFINLLGLSSGLACALLICLWVNDELVTDTFHKKSERIMQVLENHTDAGRIRTLESTAGLLAESMKEDFPEIAAATSVAPAMWFDNFTFVVEEKKTKANGQFAENDFLKIFSYPFLAGDPENALIRADQVVVSEELATRMFGSPQEALGKTFEWQLLKFRRDAVISGVFRQPDAPSSVTFDFLISYEAFKDINPSVKDWGNTGPYTYLLLHPQTDPDAFSKKIVTYLQTKDPSLTYRNLFARPYTEAYLYNSYDNGQVSGGRIEYVRLFSIIAIFILIIACINFMNLSTAKASRRIKDVGIKKAMGAGRMTLIRQYLTESVMMSGISLMVACALVNIFLPEFNQITGKELSFSFTWPLITVILLITLLTGLVSGSYPALYLSGFNPAVVLKGKINTAVGEVWARKGLVIFQFVMSAILIVSVLIVYLQIRFVQDQHLGYDRENVITFPFEGEMARNPELFLTRLSNLPSVQHASYIQQSFMDNQSTTIGLTWDGKDPDSKIPFQNFTASHELIETLGIKVIEGRNFSKDYASDSTAIILNETAVQVMGLENPIGATVNLWGTNREVIGVVQDFRYQSLHSPVSPSFIKLNEGMIMNVLVRIQGEDTRSALTAIKEFYESFNDGYSFDYRFLDTEYQEMYRSEERVADLSWYFAGLAVLISCLGLFGLAAFTAERRSKEIGIRKILGSSDFGIMLLLSHDFTKMVLTAVVIATPVSYFGASRWLENYTVRIDLEWWYFALTALLALLVAWVTVAIQTWKAARINPVQSLQNE